MLETRTTRHASLPEEDGLLGQSVQLVQGLDSVSAVAGQLIMAEDLYGNQAVAPVDRELSWPGSKGAVRSNARAVKTSAAVQSENKAQPVQVVVSGLDLAEAAQPTHRSAVSMPAAALQARAVVVHLHEENHALACLL